MNSTSFHTPPEDRIPLIQKLAYGSGAFVNNLLGSAIGGMSIVLNLGLGMDPALVGLLGALPRFSDSLTDPLMGYISDNTNSRWGRRRPYIFVGAILASLFFVLLWQLPRGQSESFYFWYFLVGSVIFYLGYTVFATPWVALGYELTPDYHERTRLMGGLFTLMPSMVADVVDLDELKTRERREGMFGSIFWWVVKLGMAVALAGGGLLLNATGVRRGVGGQPKCPDPVLDARVRCGAPDHCIGHRHPDGRHVSADRSQGP